MIIDINSPKSPQYHCHKIMISVKTFPKPVPCFWGRKIIAGFSFLIISVMVLIFNHSWDGWVVGFDFFISCPGLFSRDDFNRLLQLLSNCCEYSTRSVFKYSP